MRTATLNSVLAMSEDTVKSSSKHTFRNVRQFGKKLVKLLLTLVQFTSSSIVDTEESHDAVDDKKTIFVPHEEFSNFVQELHLMLRVDCASIGDVVLG
jgi:hypothetical protein